MIDPIIIHTHAEFPDFINSTTPVLSCGLTLNQIIAKDVKPNLIDPSHVFAIERSALPADNMFRAAWHVADWSNPKITHDITKAKKIGHTERRKLRDKEFAPHDAVIAKNIPGTDLVGAEAARAAIRQKYAVIQTQIDAANDTNEIRVALNLPLTT
jgi:hypothetical protein